MDGGKGYSLNLGQSFHILKVSGNVASVPICQSSECVYMLVHANTLVKDVPF